MVLGASVVCTPVVGTAGAVGVGTAWVVGVGARVSTGVGVATAADVGVNCAGVASGGTLQPLAIT